MATKAKEKPMVKRVKTSLALPAELWTAARIRALQEGMDAQDLVTRALEAYLKGKGGAR
jgi:predicted DNA binding CopG/RHH family protein